MARNKVSIAKYLHIQPSEIDRLSYFEYEYMIEDMNQLIKDENKQNEEYNKKYETDAQKYKAQKIPNLGNTFNSLTSKYKIPKL